MKNKCCLNCKYCFILDYSYEGYEGYCLREDFYIRELKSKCKLYEEENND